MAAGNVQAVIRIRPPKKHEQPYLQCNDRVGKELIANDLDYTDTFTAVLGHRSSQAEAFRVCGLPLVEATLQGKRTCLFAYGQTGSGKTFSMYAQPCGRSPAREPPPCTGVACGISRIFLVILVQDLPCRQLTPCTRITPPACTYPHPLPHVSWATSPANRYGAEGGKNPSKLDGLVPGICAEMFRRKQELEKRKDFQLVFEATLFEVQGNRVLDLLAEALPDGKQPILRVVGDRVLDAWIEKVHSSRGLTQMIERGMSRRTTSQNFE
eukprot:5052485-Prymnesium_polylepis.1